MESKESIGDFALRLMENEDISSTPTNIEDHTGSMPDISRIELPAGLVESMAGISVGRRKKEVIAEEEEASVVEEINVSEIKELVESLQDAISELRNLTERVNEMTTVGSIGVNMAGRKSSVVKKQKQGRDKFDACIKRVKTRLGK